MMSYAMISRHFGNSSETPVTFAKKYYGTEKNDPVIKPRKEQRR